MNNVVRLTLEKAEALCLDVLVNNGFSYEHAAAITHSVLAAQRDECHSHGLYRLIGCIETARSGGIDTHAIPTIKDEAPAIIRVNEAISAQGLVGIAMTPTHAFVAPAGGQSPLLGTNPIAFSWPRPGIEPYTFDFATSIVARGEIELHRRAGDNIPKNWAIDASGNPTTSPNQALAGAMLTFGGHKGSALSTMIELLAGPLIGDVLGHETHAATKNTAGNPHHGEIIIAFSPETFLGHNAQMHLDHAEILFEKIIEQGARLPSQRRFEARKRSLANGITIPQTLYDELNALTLPSQS